MSDQHYVEKRSGVPRLQLQIMNDSLLGQVHFNAARNVLPYTADRIAVEVWLVNHQVLPNPLDGQHGPAELNGHSIKDARPLSCLLANHRQDLTTDMGMLWFAG